MSELPSSYKPLSHLGNMPVEIFLRDYWQQKPVLIPDAFPNFTSPLSPNELAGLSLEQESEARLVTKLDQHNISLQHGPFDDTVFQSLPECDWTLLIQNLDSLEPDINALLSAFRFLPNWRLDDIMASYSTIGGGVGAHFDYYDVFLLQAEGKRRWRTGQFCDSKSKLIPGQEMHILAEFDAVNDWETSPGDLIYIPAHIAHWGESIENSITYSIGFRAPSHSEFILDYSQQIASAFTEDNRYRDPPCISQSSHLSSGEVSAESIQSLRNTLLSSIDNTESIAQWLCEYATRTKPCIDMTQFPLPFIDEETDLSDTSLQLASFCRAVFYPCEDRTLCAINGISFYTSLKLAKQLSQYETICFQSLSLSEKETVMTLIKHSFLVHCAT